MLSRGSYLPQQQAMKSLKLRREAGGVDQGRTRELLVLMMMMTFRSWEMKCPVTPNSAKGQDLLRLTLHLKIMIKLLSE